MSTNVQILSLLIYIYSYTFTVIRLKRMLAFSVFHQCFMCINKPKQCFKEATTIYGPEHESSVI